MTQQYLEKVSHLPQPHKATPHSLTKKHSASSQEQHFVFAFGKDEKFQEAYVKGQTLLWFPLTAHRIIYEHDVLQVKNHYAHVRNIILYSNAYPANNPYLSPEINQTVLLRFGEMDDERKERYRHMREVFSDATDNALTHGVYPLWDRFTTTESFLEVVEVFNNVVEEEIALLSSRRATANNHYIEELADIIQFLREDINFADIG